MLNLLLLFSLKAVVSIDINSFAFDYQLASSSKLKLFLIILIITGQILLILRLTKIKISKNLSNYNIPKQFISYGIFLLHTQHHPDCSCYSDHEITVKNHKICSGCYGSSLGILFGILVLCSSFFIILPFDIYFYAGIILIQFALLKFMFSSIFRFLLNSFFPLGVNLLLISSLIIENTVIYALFFIPILLLELVLRLVIANFDNRVKECPQGLSH